MSILEVSPVEKLTKIDLSRKHHMIFHSEFFETHQNSEARLPPCDGNSEDAKLKENYVKGRARYFETLHTSAVDVIFRFDSSGRPDRRRTGPEK